MLRAQFQMRRADEITVALADDEVSRLALEVTLLSLDLSSTLALRSQRNQRIELSPASGDVRATIRMRKPDYAEVGISRDQLGYLQMFLMRTYRDGMARVDHIHLEGTGENGPKDLTFMFDTVAPPLPPEEMTKLIMDD